MITKTYVPTIQQAADHVDQACRELKTELKRARRDVSVGLLNVRVANLEWALHMSMLGMYALQKQ